MAVLLGVLGAIGAAVFLMVMSWATDFVWEWLPAQVGLDAVPWWWVVLGLLVGAVLIIAARRLGPGMGSPLEGFHFDAALDLAHARKRVFKNKCFEVALGSQLDVTKLSTTCTLGWIASHTRCRPDVFLAISRRCQHLDGVSTPEAFL